MQVTAPVPPMASKNADVHVPPEVEALVTRLLSKEASDRLDDARELIDGINASLVSLAAAGLVDPGFAPAPSSAKISIPGLIITGAAPIVPGGVPGGVPGVAPGLAEGGAGSPDATRKVEGLLPGKTWLLAAGAGTLGLVVLVLAIVVVLRGRGEAERDGAADADVTTRADADVTTSPAPQRPQPNDLVVTEAIALIERGDYGSGIKKLEELGAAAAGREEVHRALLTAYSATDRDNDAMREAGLVLKSRPPGSDLGGEKKLRTEVRNIAVKTGSKDTAVQAAADNAWSLLENEMGTVGWGTIWELGYGSIGDSYPEARKRAKAAYAKPGAKAKMGPANAVTFELFTVGRSCGAKPLFERAASEGDERTLDLLKQLEAPLFVKSGWKTKDALQCVHDGSLKKAVAALQESLAKKK
jgi:hypothetical protein